MSRPEVDVPLSAVDLARKRTEFLFRHLQYGDTPMRMILASAYIQGMNDMFDALDHRGLIKEKGNEWSAYTLPHKEPGA